MCLVSARAKSHLDPWFLSLAWAMISSSKTALVSAISPSLASALKTSYNTPHCFAFFFRSSNSVWLTGGFSCRLKFHAYIPGEMLECLSLAISVAFWDLGRTVNDSENRWVS